MRRLSFSSVSIRTHSSAGTVVLAGSAWVAVESASKKSIELQRNFMAKTSRDTNKIYIVRSNSRSAVDIVDNFADNFLKALICLCFGHIKRDF